MLILWTLIGAWHGAGFNYVFGVGILQFLYIFLGELCNPVFIKLKKLLHINDKKLYWHIFQSLRCTLLMMFAWVFFNAKSFNAALGILKNAIAFPSFRQISNVIYSNTDAGDPINWVIFVAVSIILLIIIDLFHEKGKSIRTIVCSRSFPVRLAFYLSLVFALLIFGAYGNQYSASNFIYFEF